MKMKVVFDMLKRSQLGALLLGPDISKSQGEIVYVHIKVEGILGGVAHLLVCIAHSSPGTMYGKTKYGHKLAPQTAFLKRVPSRPPLHMLSDTRSTCLVTTGAGGGEQEYFLFLSFFTYKVEIITLLLNTLFLW